MKKLFLALLCICSIISATAQENKTNSLKQIFGTESSFTQDNVTVYQDESLNFIIKKHIEANHKLKGIPGWRVQIYFGSGHGAKEKAQELEKQFNSLYPNVDAYLFYQEPYFKIYVGNFRYKREAYKFKNQISDKFQGCWAVKDIIEYPVIE